MDTLSAFLPAPDGALDLLNVGLTSRGLNHDTGELTGLTRTKAWESVPAGSGFLRLTVRRTTLWVEAELPKILRGHNACPASSADLEGVFAAMESALVGQFGVVENWPSWQLSSVALARDISVPDTRPWLTAASKRGQSFRSFGQYRRADGSVSSLHMSKESGGKRHQPRRLSFKVYDKAQQLSDMNATPAARGLAVTRPLRLELTMRRDYLRENDLAVTTSLLNADLMAVAEKHWRATGLLAEVMPLSEPPQGCLSKLPTLGGREGSASGSWVHRLAQCVGAGVVAA